MAPGPHVVLSSLWCGSILNFNYPNEVHLFALVVFFFNCSCKLEDYCNLELLKINYIMIFFSYLSLKMHSCQKPQKHRAFVAQAGQFWRNERKEKYLKKLEY